MSGKTIINQFGANGLSNITTINVPLDTLDREIVLFGPNSNTLLGSGIISSIDKDVAPVNSFTLIANTTNPVGPDTIWLNGTTQKLYLGPNEVGGIALDVVGITPNAEGATLTAGVLALQPADATSPGVVTTNAQSFAGTKTFTEIQQTCRAA